MHATVLPLDRYLCDSHKRLQEVTAEFEEDDMINLLFNLMPIVCKNERKNDKINVLS